MESKDLKNSEELMRPVSDDSELTKEAGDTASSSVNNENEIVDEAPPAIEAEPAQEESAGEIPEAPEEAGDTTSEANEPVTVTEPEAIQETESAEAAEVDDAQAIAETVDVEIPADGVTEEVETPSETEAVAEETALADVVAEESEETKENTEDNMQAEETAAAPVAETTVTSGEEKEEKADVSVSDDTDVLELTEDEPGDDNEEGDDAGQHDYSEYSQIELVNLLREQVENEDGHDRKINLIVAAFNLKVKENIADQKKRFVDEGGNPDEFVAEEDPYENDIRELIKKHRQTRFEQAKKMEAEKEINLHKKYSIIEEIKNLLNTEESINKTFQEFRELQRLWYELGPVPQAKMKDLWDTYHFHVENFYDYIKINKELRDLDLKKNLEMKISLCEKAEELLIEPSVIRAFNTLQKFHEQWREVGPVPRDKKDEIWDRFKAVTSAINQKHQEFFEKRKVEQKRNLEAKIALCEKVEEICNMEIDSHRDWDDKSKQLIELQKVWRTIGFAPKRDNNKIYDRFRNACDQFFNKKRDFYAQNKELQNKNMQMKIDLCMEAEALKESTDWKKTTQQFIDIQKRWKEIGPVPRKHSDLLWKRFRAACDYFFDRKSEHFSDIDDEQVVNLNAKKELINEVENFVPGGDVSEALKTLREFQRKWTEIGHVPIREKDEVQNRFRTAINKHFDTLKVDSSKRESINFRSKIANLTENQRGLSKVRQEREKYMIKLKQLETDLTLLDNNIGFFANSKNAQALIADVNQKIADTREKIEMLKEKIRIIDDLDKTEY
jgi:hypothetical protein